MKMLCQNPNCDFEFEQVPANAALFACPKCHGGHFANVKPFPGLAFGAAPASWHPLEPPIIQRFIMTGGTCRRTLAAFAPGFCEIFEVKF